MGDPPSSRNGHRQVLRVSSPSNRAVAFASSGPSTVVCVSASPLHLHHRLLCLDDCAAQSLLRHPSAQGVCPADWVFVIELPLPAPSLSPTRRAPPRVVAEPYSPTCPLPHCFFFVQHNHMVGAPSLVHPVLATPTHAFVPDALLGLAKPSRTSALKRLVCIHLSIDRPVLTLSASIASSPFFYIHDGPDCVDFGIAPSHDDCLDLSPSSPWQPLCACSSIDMAT